MYCVHVHATGREGLVGSFRNFSCESLIMTLHCGCDSFPFYFLYSPVWYDREEIMEVEEINCVEGAFESLFLVFSSNDEVSCCNVFRFTFGTKARGSRSSHCRVTQEL